jgi:hypothetical protein
MNFNGGKRSEKAKSRRGGKAKLTELLKLCC